MSPFSYSVSCGKLSYERTAFPPARLPRFHETIRADFNPGPSGIDFYNAVLREDHKVTLYVGNLSKAPEVISQNPLVTVIERQLTDKEGLDQAVSCGANLYVSRLGPSVPSAVKTARITKLPRSTNDYCLR